VSFYRQTGDIHAETATVFDAAVGPASGRPHVLHPRERYRPAVPVFRLLRAPQHHDYDWTERISPLPDGKLERQIGNIDTTVNSGIKMSSGRTVYNVSICLIFITVDVIAIINEKNFDFMLELWYRRQNSHKQYNLYVI